VNYFAILVRDREPCTIQSWKNINVELKNELWNDIKKSSSSSSGITSKADIRSFRWCMARAKPTTEGTYEIVNSTTKEVLQRVVCLKNHSKYVHVTCYEMLDIMLYTL
jgi:hypothetical protein